MSCQRDAEPVINAGTHAAHEDCDQEGSPCKKLLYLSADIALLDTKLKAQENALELIQQELLSQRETTVATLTCVTKLQGELLNAVDARLAPFREAEATLRVLKWGLGAIGTAVAAIGIEALKRVFEL